MSHTIRTFTLVTALIAASGQLATADAQVEDGGGEAAAAATNATAETGTGPAVFKHGTLGLSFAVPSGGQPPPEVNLLYFTDQKTAWDVVVGAALAVTGDSTPPPPAPPVAGGTKFGVVAGLGLRMYKHHSARIHTYLEPLVKVSSADLGSIGDNLVIAGAGVIGVECLMTDWFLIGGQAGLGLSFADKFKTINVGTATSGLYATFLWD
jgi:hypothetical protein